MPLFHKRSIKEFFDEHLSKLKDQIDYEYTMEIEKKLFIEKYLANYNLNHIIVKIENIKADREIIQEDIESSNETPVRARFIKITLEIPFQGKPEYFAMIPSKLMNNKKPKAYFTSSLRAVYLPFKFSIDEDSEKIKKEIEQSKEEVLYNISCINEDIDNFNKDLKNKIKKYIEEKHNSLIKSKEIVDRLNVPIRDRDEILPYGLKDIRINEGQINISNSNLEDLFILNYVKNPQACTIIKADNNHILEIKYLDRFKNLIELNLGRNRIRRINGLTNLKNLEILNLYGNQIQKIENLDDLENLKELNLDDNSIIKISGLDNLRLLEVLSLTYNKITKVCGLENLINLIKLNLNENPVKCIGSIGFLDKLEEIWIHNHELPKTLVEDLGGISDNGRLGNLNLWKAYCRGDYVIYNNHIYTAYIDMLSKNLGLVLGHLGIKNLSDVKRLNSLTNLKELYLWNNKIKEISNIDRLISLKKLDLSKNEIEIIKGLDTLKSLKYLTISENNIKEIKGLEKLSNLTELILEKNKIMKISGLSLMKNLKELNLSSNKISKIENIGNLESLIELDLSNNLISKIESLNNNKLEVLKLSNNKNINKIEGLDFLRNLKTLNLNYCNISKFENLENLRKLDRFEITHNKLTYIEGLDSNINLRFLIINNNQIKKIEGLGSLNKLHELRIENNDLDEDFLRKIYNKLDSPIFTRNSIAYCLLELIINNPNFIKTGIQELTENYIYLVNIPYTDIKKLLNLFSTIYDFQRNNNQNVSIISPKYIAAKLDEILEPLTEGEKQTYPFILKELKMVSEDSLINIIKFIDENKMSKNMFIRTEDGIIKKRGGNVRDFINDIFICTGKTKADTRIFKNRTGIKHKDIIEYIKKKLKDKLINETHNLREEAGVDIIMKFPTKNWKIGIQIEATIDIAEIKKEERTSFVTKILSKITDSTQYDLDLFVILFCIDITVDSYDKTLGITISRLEKLPIENLLFICPESLINFFDEFNESKLI